MGSEHKIPGGLAPVDISNFAAILYNKSKKNWRGILDISTFGFWSP